MSVVSCEMFFTPLSDSKNTLFVMFISPPPLFPSQQMTGEKKRCTVVVELVDELNRTMKGTAFTARRCRTHTTWSPR